ncbi:MAG TPA: hypothetical protein VIV14_03165, partial [Gammaproteobacteria bacterium]
MYRVPFVVVALVFTAAACSPPASETTQSEAAASPVPAEFAALVLAAAPDIEITGGELSSGGNQYEVTGSLPNGDEIEL